MIIDSNGKTTGSYSQYAIAVGEQPGVRGDRMTAQASVLPIDLRARFGDRFRVTWEADGATRKAWPEQDKVWLQEIRCRYGVIYPQGGTVLAAWTDRPRIAARLRRLPFCLGVRGDAEVVATFGVDFAETIFALLRPRRQRRLTDAQRAKNQETLAQARQQRRKLLTRRELTVAGSAYRTESRQRTSSDDPEEPTSRSCS
jgi:hypothetical protein